MNTDDDSVYQELLDIKPPVRDTSGELQSRGQDTVARADIINPLASSADPVIKEKWRITKDSNLNITVFIKTVLLNSYQISPDLEIKYDGGIEVGKPSVCINLSEDDDDKMDEIYEKDKKKGLESITDYYRVRFGIANYKRKVHIPMPCLNFVNAEKITLDIKIPFLYGIHKKKKAAVAVVSENLTSWAAELKALISKSKSKDYFGRSKHKSEDFVLPLIHKDENKEIGKIFFNVELNAFHPRSFNVGKPTHYLSPPIVHLLVGGEAEEIAQHIYDTYKSVSPLPKAVEDRLRDVLQADHRISDMEFQASVLVKTLDEDFKAIISVHEGLISAIEDKKEEYDFQLNPLAYYILTDLLCISSKNPISTACDVTLWAKKHTQKAFRQRKFLMAREWQEVLGKCEDRAVQFLEISSKIISNEDIVNIGAAMNNLLWSVPDKVLEVSSVKIASHEINVDVLQQRWKTHYTNRWWGSTCCYPHEELYWFERIGIINTPRSVFWLNFIVYLIFILLGTIIIQTTDEGQYEFYTILQDQLTADGFYDIKHIDDFWNWAQVSLGQNIYTDHTQSLRPSVMSDFVMRQFRVNGTECKHISGTLCYSSLLSDESNWIKGGEWKGTEWDSITGHSIFGSRYGPWNKAYQYPPGGYVVSLPAQNQTNIVNELQRLQNESWVDIQTRAIIIELCLYNQDYSFFGLATLYVEWTPIGYVAPSAYFFILPLGIIDDASFNALHVIVIIITLGYIAQEIYEFLTDSSDKIEYLTSPENWIDFLLFTFYLIAIISHFSYGVPSDFDPYAQTFTTIYNLWLYFSVQTYIEAIFLMGLYLRIAYFFRVGQRSGSLLIVTAKLFGDMVFFTMLVGIVVGGAAVYMDVTLRDQYFEYRNFFQSFFDLVYSALGDGGFLGDSTGGLNINQFLGNCIYFLFSMFVMILLINLLIAIMNSTFETWQTEAMGMWALQFTELLHRCEGMAWPPPFNLIGFVYYAIAQHCCLDNLYSHRKIKKDKIHFYKINNNDDPCYDKDKDKVSEHVVGTDVNWIIGDKTNLDTISKFDSYSKMLPKILMETLIDINIINKLDKCVHIYLGEGSQTPLYLTLLPSTMVTIERPSKGQKWTAYTVLHEDPDALTCDEIDNRHRFKFSSDKKYNCDSCGIPSFHSLVCGEKDLEKPDGICGFKLCLKCYYYAKLDTNRRLAEERQILVVPGERWWGKMPPENVFDTRQNQLVQIIVSKYTEQNAKKSDKKEEETDQKANPKDFSETESDTEEDDKDKRKK